MVRNKTFLKVLFFVLLVAVALLINLSHPVYSNFFNSPHIKILNPQSYPNVGEDWNVFFATNGSANLTIKAVNGTRFGRDIQINSIKCENKTVDFEWVDDNTIFIQDYSCDQTSVETSKELHEGIHTIEFNFGGEIVYAHNDASRLSWLTQSGEVVMTGQTVNINLPTTVNTSKSFIILTRRASSSYDDPDKSGIYSEWVNGTRFTLNQYNPTTYGAVIDWQVIEGENIRVQSGVQPYTTSQTSFDVTINSVNVSRTAVFMNFGSCSSNNPSKTNEIFWTGSMTSSTNLHLQRDSSGNCAGNVSYYVVEFNDGSRVQSGTISNLGTSSYANFNPVNLSNTWFYFSQADTSTANGLNDASVIAFPNNNTSYHLTRLANGGTVRIQWYAISTPGAVVQTGMTDLSSSSNVNVPISNVVTNRSFVLSSFNNTGGGTTYANTMGTSRITGSIILNLQRGTTSNSQTMAWQAIEFPPYINNPPTTPTQVTCNGQVNCNVSVNKGEVVNLSASGSTDAEGDNITYNIEAGLKNKTTSQNLISSTKNISAQKSFGNYDSLINSLNPYARWKLDGDGTDSIGTLDATPNTAPSWVSKIIPNMNATQSGLFDGATNRLDVADDPGINTGTGYVGSQRALSAWFIADTIDQTGNGRAVWSEGGTTNSLSMYVYNNGTSDNVYCTAVEGGGSSDDYVSYPIQTGVLYHVGCMFNFAGNNISMYVNGNLVDSVSPLAVGTALSSHGNNNAIGGVDQAVISADGSQMTGNFSGKIEDLVYWSDGSVITSQNFSDIYDYGKQARDLESNKDWLYYNNTFNLNWKNLTYIRIKSEISYYNDSGSVSDSNNKPDLQLQVYNGSLYVNAGNFSVNSSGNFTINITDPTILQVWENKSNSNFRIRGINFDYNSSSAYDTINLTGLWVSRNGTSWTPLGNHSSLGFVSWNTSGVSYQNCIDFRTRAIDPLGSNTSSSYFDKNSCFNISDLVKPYGFLTSPSNGTITNAVSQNLSLSAYDNYNLSSAELQVYNSSGNLINQTTKSIFGTSGNLKIEYLFPYDGTFKWGYNITDSYGNSNSTKNNTIVIDTTNPSLSYSSGTLANNSNISYGSIFLNTSFYDLNFANVTYELDNSNHLVVNVTTYSDPSKKSINWTGLSEGVYYYFAKVEDLAGNSNTTLERQIRIDTTGPVVNIISPITTQYLTNVSLPLNVSVSDSGVGVSDCWWNLDNGINNSIPCNTNTTFNTTTGGHTLYFYSNDTLGNLGESSVDFSVALGGVAIEILKPQDETSFNTNKNINFSYIPKSNLLISQCDLYGNWSGSWQVNQTHKNLQNWSMDSFFVNLSSDGHYLWNVWCNDTSGESNFNVKNFTFTTDTINPLVSYSSGTLQNNTYVNSTSIYVNLSISDVNFANVTFGLYNSTGYNLYLDTFTDNTSEDQWFFLSPGAYYYNATVYDVAGNSNSTETRKITLDTQSPNANLLTPVNDTQTNNATQNLTMNATDETELSNATLNVYNSTGNLINTTTILLTGRNAVVGVVYEFLYDGVFNWFYRVFDKAGNSVVTENNTISIDTTNPSLEYSTGTASNNSQFERQWIYVNTTSSDLHFANITFDLYNSSGLVNSTTYSDSTREINWTNLLSSNVTYYYNVTSQDSYGNSNSTLTRKIELIDLTPPKVSISSPRNQTYGTNESLPLDFSASDINLDSCWYSVDNVLNQSTACNQPTTFSVSDMQEHTVRVYANDTLGRIGSSNVSFFANSSYIPVNGYFVQRGSTSFNSQSTIGISQVDPSKSFIITDTVSSSSAPSALQVTANFSDPNDLTLYNYGGGTANTEWEIITGPDITVQRGVVSYSSSDSSINVSISSINLSSSFIIVDNRLNTGTGSQYNLGLWKGSFINSSSLNFERGGTGVAGEVSWQVVSWKGVNVQRGNATISGTSTSVTSSLTNSIQRDRSFLIFSGEIPSSSTGLAYWNVKGNLGSNSIDFSRTTASGDYTASWFVISGDLFNVINGSTSVSSSLSAPFSGISNVSKSFRWQSHDSTGTGTTNANSRISSKIASSSLLDLNKGTTAQTNVVDWQVIEIVDRVSPKANLLTPANNTYSNKTSLNLTVNTTDETELGNATLYVYNSTGNLINTTNILLSGTQAVVGAVYHFLYDGVFNWFYRVFDKAGNSVATENNTLTIDTITPLISFGVGVETNNTNLSRNWIYVNTTYSDTNFANVTYSLYNGTLASNLVNKTTYTTTLSSQINWTNLVDGEYYYRATAQDLAGNTNSTETRKINLDTTPPTMEIKYPLNKSYNYSPTTLNYTYSDLNPGYCWYSNDSGVTNSSSVLAGTNFTNFLASEGTNNIILYCNDSVGNENSTSVTFLVDTVPPQVSFSLGTEQNDSFVSRNWVYANLSVVETNFANVTFNLYNSTGVVNSTTYLDSTREINWTSLSNGNYTYNATVYDVAGNSNSTETRKITLDTQSPNANLLTPVNDTQTNNATQNLTMNATDETELSNATLNVYNSTGNLINTTTILLTGRNAVVGVVYEFLYDGVFNWFYRVFDKAGNSVVTENNTITVDTTSPNVSLDLPLNGEIVVKNNFFSANFSDATNLSNATFYLWNSTGAIVNSTTQNLSGLTNSTNLSVSLPYYDTFSWNYYACDPLGNCGFALANRTVIYEKPSIGLETIYPLSDITVAQNKFFNVTLNVSCLSGVCGVANVSLDPTNWWNANWLYRKKIDLGGVGNNLSNFQVLVTTNLTSEYVSGKVKSDCGDIRFVNSTNSQLNYFVQSCNVSGGNSQFWVKVPSINATGNTTISMYYGNSAASSVSNGTTTFDFYDDFSGSLSKWTIEETSGVYPRIENGYLVAGGGTTASPYGHTSIGSSATYSNFTNGTIAGSIYLTTNSIGEVAFRGNNGANTGYKGRADARASQGLSFLTPPYSGWGFLSGCSVSGTAPPINQWIPFNITVTGNTFTINVGSYTKTCTSSLYNSAGEIALQNHYGSYTRYDNVSVRQYYPTNPSVSVGSEEIAVKSGLVSSVVGDVPFYTNISNPYTTSSLTKGQSKIINFWVNATGTGTNVFYAYANLTSNMSISNITNSWNVTIDGIPPQLTIVSPINKTYNTSFGIYFNVSGSENLSFCNVSLNNWATNYSLDKINSTYYSSKINVSDGVYTAKFYCADLVGNVNQSTQVNFTQDRFGANASLVSPLNNTYSNNTFQNLTLSANDSVGLGNAILNIYNSTGDLINTTNILLTGRNAVVGVVYEFLYDGVFNWFYRVFDTSGHETNTENNTIIIDTTIPLISFSSGTSANNTNASRSWIYANVSLTEKNPSTLEFYLYNGSSGNHLVNKTTYLGSETSVNWSSLSDGVYYYFAKETDLAGNSNSTEKRKIRLDTSAPTITQTFPVDGLAYGYNITHLNYSVSDPLISTCWYNINDTANISISCSGTGISTFLSDGNYTWNMYANDTLGHLSHKKDSFLVDTHLPEILIFYPQNVSYNYNVSAMNFSITGQSLDSCWYSSDKGINNVTIPCNQNLTGLSSNEGQNEWRLYANNSVGGETYDFVDFSVDTISPHLNAISPTNKTYYPSTIDFNVSSNEDLSFCNLSIDNWNTNYSMGKINSTYFSYTLSPSPGSYTARFLCADLVGNVNNSVSVPFNVSYPNISLSVVQPSSNEKVVQNENFNFSVNVTCQVSDCGSINVTLDPLNNWWNNSWLYRQQISLSVPFGSTVKNYQEKIVLNSSNVGSNFDWNSECVNSNSSRIRFVNSNQNQTLNYWVESCSSSNQKMVVWVKVDQNITTSTYPIYMYYDNPTAIPYSNGTATFNYFDAGNLSLVSPWSFSNTAEGQDNTTGYPAPSYYAVSQNGDYMYKDIGLTTNKVIDFSVNSNGLGNFYFLTNSAGAGQHFRAETRAGNNAGIGSAASWTSWSVPSQTCANILTNTWYNFSLVIGSTTARAYIDGTACGGAYTFSNNGPYIGLIGDGLGAAYTTWWDNIRVREYSAATPSYTLGSQEGGVKGIVSTTSGAQPFYADQNPIITSSLSKGQSQVVNFLVNATGPPGTYTFFAFGNLTRNQSVSNVSNKRNITIITEYITLVSPLDSYNFSNYSVPQFKFSTDSNNYPSCELWGNWSSGWHLNQTISSVSANSNVTFSGINTSSDGFYIWNVKCNDSSGRIVWGDKNFTFSTYLPPTEPVLINITQSKKDGTGNVTFNWNSTNHTVKYKIYAGDSLNNFTYLGETNKTNFTDVTFAGNRRRFYEVKSSNPGSENSSSEYFGAEVYTLSHTSEGTNNFVGFPVNFSYLKNANQTLKDIQNATSIVEWNATLQQRVACNDFSCPNFPSCTGTNCNFDLEKGKAYEVSVNSSSPTSYNWSGVGKVYPSSNITLIKNSTSFGQNWISMYANTTLSNAQGLLNNITNSDTVSRWNPLTQSYEGYLHLFGPIYLGTNFPITLEEGYEVSVTNTGNWTQV